MYVTFIVPSPLLPSVMSRLPFTPVLFLSIATVLSAASAPLALAQEPPVAPYGDRDLNDIDLKNAYRLPLIYVTDLAVTQKGAKVTGEFTVSNKGEDLIGGLMYTIEVLGTNEETLYARTPVREQFALRPGEEVRLPIAYKLPSLPAGAARLRIQIVTSDGRYLGWMDQSITGGTSSIITLKEGGIQSSEYANQTLEPLTGPNVSADSAFALSVVAKNDGNKAVTLTPTIEVYAFDASRSEATVQHSEAVTLNVGEERSLSIPVVSMDKPGTYSALLSLRDAKGNTVSSLVEYRWVVRGVSADILPPHVRALGTKAGEQAIIDIAVVGAPDAETRFEGYTTVQLLDNNGLLAEAKSSSILLTDGVASSTTRLTLKRDIAGTPVLRVTLSDAKGAVLTERSITLPATAVSSTSSLINWKGLGMIGGGAAVLALLALGLLFGLRSKRVVLFSSLQSVAMLVLFLAGSGTAFGAISNGVEVVTAADISVWHNVISGRPLIMMFINAPIHDAPTGTYLQSAVPFQYRVSYAVCANRTSVARVIARYDKNGGKHSTIDGPAGAQWQKVHDQQYSQFGCPPGVVTCIAPDGVFSGTVDMSGLSTSACSTTLQVAAKLGQGDHITPYIPDDVISSTDRWINDLKNAEVVNLWVNFACGPNLILNKSGPASAVRGSVIPYVLTVTNNTAQNSTNVVITDPVPSNLTYSQAASDARCSLVGSTVTCNIGTVASGQSISLTVGFTVNTMANCVPMTVTNTANVTSTPPPANTTNTQTFVTTPITCPGQADLSIVKNGPASILRGDNPMYIVSVTNTGPETATNVVITDPIPAGATFVPAQSDALCGVQGANVICALGSITANQSKSVTIVFNMPIVQNCTSTTIQNTATVSASQSDPTPANNASNVVATTVGCGTGGTADLSLTKTGPATGIVGQPLVYTLTINNSGPGTAQGVTISDLIPPAATFQTASETCAVNGPNVVCSIGSIAPNAPKTMTITFLANGPAQCNNTFNTFNVAVIDSQTSDPNPNNNTSTTVSTTLSCVAAQCADTRDNDNDGVIDRADPDCHTDGDSRNNASYDGNRNESGTSGIPQCQNNLDDDSDNKVDFPNDPGCSSATDNSETNAGGASCDNGIDDNNNGTIDCRDPVCHTDNNASNVASCNPGGTEGGGTGGTPQCRDNVDNDSDGRTDAADPQCHTDGNPNNGNSYNPNGSTEFGTGATCSDGRDNDNDGLIDGADPDCHSDGNAGNPASYNPNGNEGNSRACNDNIDNDGDGLIDGNDPGCHTDFNRYNSASYDPNGTNEAANNGRGTCSDGIDNNANGLIDAQDPICHTDGNPNNLNSFTAYGNEGNGGSSSSNGNQNFSITISDGRSSADPDETLTYVITVRNDGQQISNATVTATLSDEVNIRDMSNNGFRSGRFITWSNQSFSQYESRTYTVTATVQDDADGTLESTAQIFDRIARDTTVVGDDDNGDDSELSVRKTANTQEVFPGGMVEYTITVENTGDATIRDIRIEDRLPSGISVIDDGDADTHSNSKLTWEISSLAKNKDKTFRYRLTVPSYATPGTILKNDVRVRSDADNNDIDEKESVTITIIGNQTLPQTGSQNMSSPTIHLTPITQSSPAQSSAMLWLLLTLIPAGLGLGMKAYTMFTL